MRFVFAPWLALKPRVWIADGCLLAQSSLAQELVTAFARRRWLCVDPANEVIHIVDRWFWLLKVRKDIPFLRILGLDYRYEEMWGLMRLLSENGDGPERFIVSLKLLGPEEILPLFAFVGEGTGYDRTWLERLVLGLEPVGMDLAGDQEATSRHFFRLLGHFTGKPLA